MKFSNILYITAFSFFMASCSSEDDAPIDYSGVYDGTLICTGELVEETGEEAVITISADAEGKYTVDLGEDIVFDAVVVDDILVIAKQYLNEGGDFDSFAFEGTIEESQGSYNFDLTITESTEGNGECAFPIVKRK